MQRYSPELFSTLKRATTFGNCKPLELDILEFYAFIVQRLLNNTEPPEIPRGSSKTGVLFDLLQLDAANPLSVYKHSNIIYLPDGNVTWSVNQYV